MKYTDLFCSVIAFNLNSRPNNKKNNSNIDTAIISIFKELIPI